MCVHHDFRVPKPALIDNPVQDRKDFFASKELATGFRVREGDVEPPLHKAVVAAAHDLSMQGAELSLVDAFCRGSIVSLLECKSTRSDTLRPDFEIDVNEPDETPARGTEAVRYGAAAPNVVRMCQLGEAALGIGLQDAVDNAARLVLARVVDENDLAPQIQRIEDLKNFIDARFEDAFLIIAGEDERKIRWRGDVAHVSLACGAWHEVACKGCWSERRDLNSGPPVPQSGVARCHSRSIHNIEAPVWRGFLR